MIKIYSDLVTKTLPSNGWSQSTEDFTFAHPAVGIQTIPKGFNTDFASIPCLFKRIYSVNGVHREEAFIHDWIYSLRGVLPKGIVLAREEADRVFYDFLRSDENLSSWRAWTMYKAVRVGGWLSWK